MQEAVLKSEAFAGWAIVELMGHRIRAGEVKEVEMAGAKMLRVDIHCDDGAVLTEYYSPSALYSLRPCSQEIAKAEMAAYRDPRPVRPAEYREDKDRPTVIAREEYEAVQRRNAIEMEDASGSHAHSDAYFDGLDDVVTRHPPKSTPAIR